MLKRTSNWAVNLASKSKLLREKHPKTTIPDRFKYWMNELVRYSTVLSWASQISIRAIIFFIREYIEYRYIIYSNKCRGYQVVFYSFIHLQYAQSISLILLLRMEADAFQRQHLNVNLHGILLRFRFQSVIKNSVQLLRLILKLFRLFSFLIKCSLYFLRFQDICIFTATPLLFFYVSLEFFVSSMTVVITFGACSFLCSLTLPSFGF